MYGLGTHTIAIPYLYHMSLAAREAKEGSKDHCEHFRVLSISFLNPGSATSCGTSRANLWQSPFALSRPHPFPSGSFFLRRSR